MVQVMSLCNEPLVGPKAPAINPKKENSNTTSTRMSSSSMSSSSAAAPTSAAAETKTQGYVSEMAGVSPTLHLHGTHVETHNVGVQVSQPPSVAQLPLSCRFSLVFSLWALGRVEQYSTGEPVGWCVVGSWTTRVTSLSFLKQLLGTVGYDLVGSAIQISKNIGEGRNLLSVCRLS